MNILKKYEYILKNLDCANCANKIQNKLAENKDYKNVVVNFNTLKLSFESELEDVKKDVENTVKSLEPDVEIHEKNEKIENKINYNLIRLIIGIFIITITNVIAPSENIYKLLMILAYIILLVRTAKNSIKLLKKKVIDENFLITISCIGAFLIGEIFEGAMVIILYEIGKFLEEKAINNTRKSISDLMDIRPEYANLKCEEHEEEHHHEHEEGHHHEAHEHKVSPEKVNIGDTIIVKQGEKIPLDGIVVLGSAKLNTASLTGESKLREVTVNDTVLSGSINEDGLLEINVTEKYENSTVSKILSLVEDATDKKAKTETFVNKASRIYTPIVICLAILVVILLPLLFNITLVESIYRGLIFLVVSCPCAIVISVPLSYFSGIGKASKKGILVKGSNYLDAIRNVKYIAFDKTGTLTKGKFEVNKINSYDESYSESDILEYAAKGEAFSNHPLAVAILEKYGKTIDKSDVKDFDEVSGKGITYKINSKVVKIGNSEFTNANDKDNKLGTAIYVNIDEKLVGSLILNDTVKEETKEVIAKLNKLNVETVMYTGDNLEVAKQVAKEIEIKTVKAEMLPTDKYKEVEKVLNDKNGIVAFVGDGINDSPVLALADVGISMGGIGASSAIEASDIVIMTDDLRKIIEGIEISKYTNKIIKQNLIFAFGVKVLVLILSVIGLSNMALAVFADVGVTLITILNTLRILKIK